MWYGTDVLRKLLSSDNMSKGYFAIIGHFLNIIYTSAQNRSNVVWLKSKQLQFSMIYCDATHHISNNIYATLHIIYELSFFIVYELDMGDINCSVYTPFIFPPLFLRTLYTDFNNANGCSEQKLKLKPLQHWIIIILSSVCSAPFSKYK